MAKRVLMLVGDFAEDYEGNIVTAPAWPAHVAWLKQFLAVLGVRIMQQEVAGVRV